MKTRFLPPRSGVRQARLALLLRHIQVLPFDAAAAEAYGQIIALCGWVKGRDFDRMIAAHAISARAVLVTNNAGDFRDIPNLSVENLAPASVNRVCRLDVATWLRRRFRSAPGG